MIADQHRRGSSLDETCLSPRTVGKSCSNACGEEVQAQIAEVMRMLCKALRMISEELVAAEGKNAELQAMCARYRRQLEGLGWRRMATPMLLDSAMTPRCPTMPPGEVVRLEHRGLRPAPVVVLQGRSASVPPVARSTEPPRPWSPKGEVLGSAAGLSKTSSSQSQAGSTAGSAGSASTRNSDLCAATASCRPRVPLLLGEPTP